MNLALVAFLAYTGVLLAIGIWSYRIVEKVPIAKYEEEFYAAGRGLGGVVVALIIGQLVHRNFNLIALGLGGVVVLYLTVYAGSQMPLALPECTPSVSTSARRVSATMKKARPVRARATSGTTTYGS